MSPRDRLLLTFLCRHKAAPADVLTALFFEENPNHGGKNKNPAEAFRRARYELTKRGLLQARTIRTGTRDTVIVEPTRAAARELGLPPARGLDPRATVHHVETLRAILPALRRDATGSGLQLEHHLRAQAQKGGTRPGAELPVFPDAVITDGATGESIGVEYVTSKYSDAMILGKLDGLRAYDRALFFADKARTQARVSRVTGVPCFLVGERP